MPRCYGPCGHTSGFLIGRIEIPQRSVKGIIMS